MHINTISHLTANLPIQCAYNMVPNYILCISLFCYSLSHPVECPSCSPDADAVDNEHQQDREGEVGVYQVGVVRKKLLATQEVEVIE